jgi:hypothetical protein
MTGASEAGIPHPARKPRRLRHLKSPLWLDPTLLGAVMKLSSKDLEIFFIGRVYEFERKMLSAKLANGIKYVDKEVGFEVTRLQHPTARKVMLACR